MKPKQRNYSALLILCLIVSGCATRTSPVINPALPRTALQWTVIYNGAVAKTNRAVEQSVEAVQKQGLISVEQARPVIMACGKVATVSESVRSITSAGTEASWNVDGPKIRDLLTNAHISIPASANATVDLAVSTLNAALTLLTAEVK